MFPTAIKNRFRLINRTKAVLSSKFRRTGRSKINSTSRLTTKVISPKPQMTKKCVQELMEIWKGWKTSRKTATRAPAAPAETNDFLVSRTGKSLAINDAVLQVSCKTAVTNLSIFYEMPTLKIIADGNSGTRKNTAITIKINGIHIVTGKGNVIRTNAQIQHYPTFPDPLVANLSA